MTDTSDGPSPQNPAPLARREATMAIERILMQRQSTAAFASVEVDVVKQQISGPPIVRVATDAELTHGNYYVQTATVGVLTAVEFLRLDVQVIVEIRKILTSYVDSTHPVVLLAAARATLSSAGLDPNLIGELNATATVVQINLRSPSSAG
jgi:hypothetical protein